MSKGKSRAATLPDLGAQHARKLKRALGPAPRAARGVATAVLGTVSMVLGGAVAAASGAAGYVRGFWSAL
jgi:hypothetical protein